MRCGVQRQRDHQSASFGEEDGECPEMRSGDTGCGHGGASLGENATNCCVVAADATTGAHFLARRTANVSKCDVVTGHMMRLEAPGQSPYSIDKIISHTG